MIEEIDRRLYEDLSIDSEILELQNDAQDVQLVENNAVNEVNEAPSAWALRAALFTKWVETVQCQFLCGYPIEEIKWQDSGLHSATSEEQEMVLKYTHGHRFNSTCPVDFEYQSRFMNRLLTEIGTDNAIPQIHDSFRVAKQNATKHQDDKVAYKHYLGVDRPFVFILQEGRYFGTDPPTGLRTSAASLALTDYLVSHVELVAGRNMMELGGGVGQCSLIVQYMCLPRNVLLTDGNMRCVRMMRRNYKLNFECFETRKGIYELRDDIMMIQQLKWNNISKGGFVQRTEPQLLLAAEVVSNYSMNDFVHAVDYVFNLMGQEVTMLLSNSVTNEQTLGKLLEKLTRLKFTIKDEPLPAAHECLFHWDRSTPIRILKITRDKFPPL